MNSASTSAVSKKITIVVPRDRAAGTRAIHSPESAKILSALGGTETRRASHVEPPGDLSQAALEWLLVNNATAYSTLVTDLTTAAELLPADSWWADMLPVGGPVLGPYFDKNVALAEEVKWLTEHGIPTANDPR